MCRLDLRNSLYASIAAFVMALAILSTVAQPAAAAFREVSPTGSDTGNNCLIQSGPCATIQHAIDEAENGDWVDVRAGTYGENVTIDKPLTLIGPNGNALPGEPQAIVDGGSGTAIRPESHGITIRGMTVTAGATGTAIRTAGADVDELEIQGDIISGGSSGVRLEAGGEKISIVVNLIEGVANGLQLSGTAYSSLSVESNRFDASIGADAVLADSGTTIEGFELWGNKVSAPTRIAGRITKRQGQENDLAWNSFDSTSGPQLAINGEDVRVMENSFEGNGTASCLQILGSQGGLTPSDGILASGNEFGGCNPYGIELGPEVNAVNVRSNDFFGSYDGIITSIASPWSVTGRVQIVVNRIFGTTHLGIDNTASGTLDAEQNWWGCNSGPGSAGCDGVRGGVDTEDPVTLDALIGPRQKETGIEKLPSGSSITLNPGEQAEVAAFLTADGSEPNLGVPAAKAQVGFSSSLGTLNPATTTLFNGWTKAIFTAGAAPGQGWITVSMDNQQTLVPVTIPGAMAGTPTTATLLNPLPAPTIVISGKRHLQAGRRATIGTVSCADSCRVTPGSARIAIGHNRYRGMVTPRGSLAAGSTTPIRVALSPPARRALKKLGSARIQVTVTVVDASGQTVTRAISVRVQR